MMGNEVVIRVPDEATALRAKGNELFVNRKFSEASQQYSRIINKYGLHTPRDFMTIVFCNRAACDIELGRYKEAVNDLNFVLMSPDGIPSSTLSRAYFRLARCYFELRSYDEAKAQMDNYDKSMDSTTISINQPAVTKLKKEINDKRNEMKNKGKKSRRSRPQAPWRPITYEARVVGSNANPFYRQEMAPAVLCDLQPPDGPMHSFLRYLVTKYDKAIFKSRPYWLCEKCGDRAKRMVHLPCSYLHLPDAPLVVDLLRPVCGTYGGCDRIGRVIDELFMDGFMDDFFS